MKNAVRAFARVAARVRAQVWPVTVRLDDDDETELQVAKSATKDQHFQQEQGAGMIHQTIATFNFPVAGDYVPKAGDEWTIIASELDDEIGTVWRCVDLTRSAAGTEHSCVAKRND